MLKKILFSILLSTLVIGVNGCGETTTTDSETGETVSSKIDNVSYSFDSENNLIITWEILNRGNSSPVIIQVSDNSDNKQVLLKTGNLLGVNKIGCEVESRSGSRIDYSCKDISDYILKNNTIYPLTLEDNIIYSFEEITESLIEGKSVTPIINSLNTKISVPK